MFEVISAVLLCLLVASILWSRRRLRLSADALERAEALPACTVSEHASLRQAVEEAEAKVGRYFQSIQSMERQRDEWRALYQEQALTHSNAQEMMMGLIEHAGRLLATKGINLKIPSIIQVIREQFHEQHTLPVRKAIALMRQQEQAQAAAKEPRLEASAAK